MTQYEVLCCDISAVQKENSSIKPGINVSSLALACLILQDDMVSSDHSSDTSGVSTLACFILQDDVVSSDRSSDTSGVSRSSSSNNLNVNDTKPPPSQVVNYYNEQKNYVLLSATLG